MRRTPARAAAHCTHHTQRTPRQLHSAHTRCRTARHSRRYIIDAEGQTLGRMASLVAKYIRGKNSPLYTPSMDTGAMIIVVNAEKVTVTGRKFDQKVYKRHVNGLPGSMKVETFKHLQARPAARPRLRLACAARKRRPAAAPRCEWLGAATARRCARGQRQVGIGMGADVRARAGAATGAHCGESGVGHAAKGAAWTQDQAQHVCACPLWLAGRVSSFSAAPLYTRAYVALCLCVTPL